jgi:predicted permease
VAAEGLLFFACLLAGASAQLHRRSEAVRGAVWVGYFWTVTPLLVFVTFSTLRVDGRLAHALAAAIVATWLVAGAGYVYALLVASERDERGALALAAGFPNTGFVGYPLAQLAFGHPGLALAVLYDRLAWLVPTTAISTAIARLHGRRSIEGGNARPLRALVANPPLAALALAVGLRAAGVHVPFVHAAGAGAAAIVGPAGFLLLGLSLQFERPSHPPAELGRAAGALAVRFLGGPLMLFAVGRALGAEIPAVFYLLAGMPAAFHLLVLARVYDMRPGLMRLLVVGSTLPAVAAVVLVSGFSH